jgi:hypothetical protein
MSQKLSYLLYDKKYWLVHGDRNRYSSVLRTVGAKWHSNISKAKGYNPGWLVPIEREAELVKIINDVNSKANNEPNEQYPPVIFPNGTSSLTEALNPTSVTASGNPAAQPGKAGYDLAPGPNQPTQSMPKEVSKDISKEISKEKSPISKPPMSPRSEKASKSLAEAIMQLQSHREQKKYHRANSASSNEDNEEDLPAIVENPAVNMNASMNANINTNSPVTKPQEGHIDSLKSPKGKSSKEKSPKGKSPKGKSPKEKSSKSKKHRKKSEKSQAPSTENLPKVVLPASQDPVTEVRDKIHTVSQTPVGHDTMTDKTKHENRPVESKVLERRDPAAELAAMIIAKQKEELVRRFEEQKRAYENREKPRGIEPEKGVEKHRHEHRSHERERHRYKNRERHRDKDRDKDRERHRDKDRDKDRERHRDKDRDKNRDRDRHKIRSPDSGRSHETRRDKLPNKRRSYSPLSTSSPEEIESVTPSEDSSPGFPRPRSPRRKDKY